MISVCLPLLRAVRRRPEVGYWWSVDEQSQFVGLKFLLSPPIFRAES